MAANRDAGTGSITDSLPAVEAPAADVPAINVDGDGDVPAAPAAENSDLPKPAE